MPGSVWMFHTNLTGIAKANVSVVSVIFMFLLYPVWTAFGYIFALCMDIGYFLLPIVSYEDVNNRVDKPPKAEVEVFRYPKDENLPKNAI